MNQALLSRVWWRLNQGGLAEGLSDCDHVVERLATNASIGMLSRRAGWRGSSWRARSGAADAMYGLGRLDEARAGYDEVIERLEADESAEVQAHVTGAWNGKASLLAKAGQVDEAQELWETLIARYEDAPNRETQAVVEQAIANKGRERT